MASRVARISRRGNTLGRARQRAYAAKQRRIKAIRKLKMASGKQPGRSI